MGFRKLDRRTQSARRTVRSARDFHVLVATDGSPKARAAVTTAIAFPWPPSATAEGLIARGTAHWRDWPLGSRCLDPIVSRLAERTRRALRRRWRDAEVTVVDDEPIAAILARARKAAVVVIGARGHGALARMVLGSVSRAVVRRAKCSVLVVKGRSRLMRSLIVGLDGSPNAERAVAFVARLAPPEGGSVKLLRVVEPVRVSSLGLLPSRVRAVIGGEAAELESERVRTARRDVDKAAGLLKRTGWDVRAEVQLGVPADALLAVAKDADVVIVGARGAGGIGQFVLGSVADAVLTRVRAAVLLVK